jgi:heavy metal sensor kinase
MNTRSIRFQLLAWYAALLTASFAVFGLFMYGALGTFLRQNLKDNLARRAHMIAHSISLRGDKLTPEWLQEEIGSRYAPESSGRFVRVSRGGTNILYESKAPHDNSFQPWEVPSSRPQNKETVQRAELAAGGRMLIEELPVTTAGGPLLVEVGASLNSIGVALGKVVESLFISVPVLIIVAAIGAYILIGRALRPVVKIASSAEQISLHNLSERLPMTQTGDELEALSLSLNRMITRINEAYDYTRRFVADASHELRTPLAILQGELENVLSRNELAADTRETLGSNLEEVERLAKIVEGLFALSRLDSGQAHSETIRFDLAKLAATTTEQMCLLAEDKEISLKCKSDGPVPVKGDRARLKQVIVNLVDNAIKYTSSAGAVTVNTFVEGVHAVLEVTDNGIGIPKEALPHIFERFYRVDKARSRDQGGAGLGLSIVKSICTAHEGALEVESTEGRGSRFRLRLPLASTK